MFFNDEDTKEKAVEYRPGTVLLYRMDTFHRGTPIKPGAERLTHHFGFKRASAECEPPTLQSHSLHNLHLIKMRLCWLPLSLRMRTVCCALLNNVNMMMMLCTHMCQYIMRRDELEPLRTSGRGCRPRVCGSAVAFATVYAGHSRARGQLLGRRDDTAAGATLPWD